MEWAEKATMDALKLACRALSFALPKLAVPSTARKTKHRNKAVVRWFLRPNLIIVNTFRVITTNSDRPPMIGTQFKKNISILKQG